MKTANQLPKGSVVFLTSTRAESRMICHLISLFPVAPVDKAILITGSHLETEFGVTSADISVPENVKIFNLYSDFIAPMPLAKKVATAISLFEDFFHTRWFDYIVIVGDRFEAMAASIAAFSNGIKVIHFHGGETTLGSQDDYFRDVITRFSSVHFVSTETHRERVKNIVSSESVYVVGAIGTSEFKVLRDTVGADELLSDKTNEIIFCFHTSEVESISVDTLVQFLGLLLDRFDDHEVTILGGNIDGDGKYLNDRLRSLAAVNSNARFTESLSRRDYLRLLARSKVLIGNSSSGIYEAPYVLTTFLHLGRRQVGREHSELNTIWIEDITNANKVLSLLEHVISDPEFSIDKNFGLFDFSGDRIKSLFED